MHINRDCHFKRKDSRDIGDLIWRSGSIRAYKTEFATCRGTKVELRSVLW